MPMFYLRRRVVRAVAMSGALVIVFVVVATTGGSEATGSDGGPVVTAEIRSLRATTSLVGVLARADTTTLVYGGGRTSEASLTSAVPAASLSDSGSGTRLAAADSCSPTSTTTSTTGTSTTTTTACPTTTTSSTTTTTTPAPPSTTTTAPSPPGDNPPPSGATDTTVPGETSPPTAPGSADAGAPSGAPGSGGGQAASPGGGSGVASEERDESVVITALRGIGEIADRGDVLYATDGEPVVALVADDPLFRDLEPGVDDGSDIEALESNLAVLGYGDSLTVDETFTAATAAAVEAWEEDLGRGNPDGTVSVGEVVFLAERAAVLRHDHRVGDVIEPGAAVLTLGTESQVVEVGVDAEDLSQWTVDLAVELVWGDGTTSTGTVIEVGRDESDGEVVVVVALPPSSAERPVGTEVEVVRTLAERDGVVAVPVAVVVEGEDGPAVRVPAGEGDRLVPVELGVVAEGWVEITDGLEAGTGVRLPG